MKAKPNDMQAEQQDQPATALQLHTKARAPAASDKPKEIGAKLKTALQAIVWQGQELKEAADLAGLHCITLRKAIAKPHVQRFLKQERQVFIDHARAQNVHHAKRIRDGENAAASMRAIDFIENVGTDGPQQGARATSPGIVIVIGREKTVNLQAKPLELQVEALPCKGDAVDDGA